MHRSSDPVSEGAVPRMMVTAGSLNVGVVPGFNYFE